MKLIYVAGPFRGANAWEVENNIRRAESLALEVWRLGAAVICPHCNTRFFSGAADDSIWLAGDIEMLRRCDAIIVTPDWRKSTGARAEVEFAYSQGIPQFIDIGTLKEWLAVQVEVDECRVIEKSRNAWFDHCERVAANFFKS